MSSNKEGTHIFEKIAAVVKEHLKISLGSETSKSDEAEAHAIELDPNIDQTENNVINDASATQDEDDDSEDFDEYEQELETEFETLNAQP